MSIYSIKYKGNEDVSNVDMVKSYMITGGVILSLIFVISIFI